MKLPFASLCACGLLLQLGSPASAQWTGVQHARLEPAPNELSISDQFGAAVALDGGTLAVGAPWHDPLGGAPNDGAAWVFERGATGWAQTVKLRPSVVSGGRFGSALAIAGDTLFAGAPYESFASTTSPGAVYVYERLLGSWIESARLTASDYGQYDLFGSALALSGELLAIGAPRDDSGGIADRGSVYVFERVGGAWVERARLTASDAGSFDQFGASVALDGERLIVGAPRADIAGRIDQGAAYVFERSGATWTQVAKLVAADGLAVDTFGHAVALDGGTAVVGAPLHDAAGSSAGAAYVFVGAGAAWTLEAKLEDFGSVYVDQFGAALDLEDERLVVGLPYNGVPAVASGGVQLFTRSAGVWTAHIELIGSDTDGIDFLGSSVALSGENVASGAPSAETWPSNLSTGEAYVFELVPPPLVETYCTAKTNSLGCVPAMSWSGSPSASNPTPFRLQCAQVLNFKSGLLFYGYAPSATPFQGGWLCVAPPLRRTPLQNSLGTVLPAADCTGAYSFDMNARIQSGTDALLVAGAQVWAQYWMRDPQAPSATALSDAVHFEIDP